MTDLYLRVRPDDLRCPAVCHQHKLSTLPEDDLTSAAAGGAAQVSPRVTVREELDELVAAECLYCGDYLIRSVVHYFIRSVVPETKISSGQLYRGTMSLGQLYR